MKTLLLNEWYSGRVRSFAFASLLILTLFGCGATPSKQTDGEGREKIETLNEVDSALMNSALSAMRDEDYARAEKDLKILLTRRKNVAEPWVNYALCLYYQGKSDQLTSALRELETRFKDVPHAYNLQGLMAVKRGEFDVAESYYLKALKLDPEYANAWFNLAYLQDVYLQNIVKAVEHYDRYLKLRPDDQETKAWRESLALSLEHEI